MSESTQTAPTGNISLGQLSSLLSKQAPAAEAAPSKATKKAAPTATETSTEQSDEVAEQTEVTETNTDPETEIPGLDDPETEEGEPAEETESEESEETEGDETTATKTGLHPELLAAIEEAKLDKGKGSLLKRVHKVVDQRDTERLGRLQAEQALTAAQQEIEKLRTKGPGNQAPSTDRYANIPEIAAFNESLESAERVLEWADANEDGATVKDAKGNEVEYSAEQVRGIRRKAEREQARLQGEKSAVLGTIKAEEKVARQEFHRQALQAYPWLAKKESVEYSEAVQVLHAIPGIRDVPDFELAIGDYLRGYKARMAEAAKGKPGIKAPPMAKPAGGSTPPPVVTRPGGATPKGDQKQKAVKESEAQFSKSGKVSDLAKMLATSKG